MPGTFLYEFWAKEGSCRYNQHMDTQAFVLGRGKRHKSCPSAEEMRDCYQSQGRREIHIIINGMLKQQVISSQEQDDQDSDRDTEALCTKNPSENHKFSQRFQAAQQVALTHTDQSIPVLSQCHSQIRQHRERHKQAKGWIAPWDSGSLKDGFLLGAQDLCRMDCSLGLRYRQAAASNKTITWLLMFNNFLCARSQPMDM